MSALDKFYDFTLNLPDAKLTSKAMSLCNIDRNVFNIYLTLQEGKNSPILNADLSNYTVTMIVVKPKTKEYVEKVGVIDGSNDRLLFELGETFNDQIGSYKGEIKVQNGDEVITSSSFAYTVTQSLISGLNAEIEANPDVEVLRQLINEVKAAVGMTPEDPDSLLTDYQKKTDETLTTTNKTIIGAINENSSQIKEKATKQEVEIERRRIDSFTSLVEGSTTGDAELIDARIGADGMTYNTLGSAVRTQFLDVSDNISFLENAIGLDYTDSMQIDLEVLKSLNGYLDTDNTVKSLTNSKFVVDCYKVQKGKTYILYGDRVRLASTYPLAGFASSELDVNASFKTIMEGTATRTDYRQQYIPNSNGYIFIAKHTDFGVLKVALAGVTTEIEELKSDIRDTNNDVDIIMSCLNMDYTQGNKVVGVDNVGYFMQDNLIHSISSDKYKVTSYKVSKGKKYVIKGSGKLNASLPLVCFGTQSIGDNISYTEVILEGANTVVSYDVTYKCPLDGYIYVAWVYEAYKLELYDTVLSSKRLDNIEDGLKSNKVFKMQIFGDSISDETWRSDKTTWVNYITEYVSQNATIVNSAVGGSGIGHGYSNGGGRFPEKTDGNYVYDLMTDGTLEADNDIIVMFVGTNNWAGNSYLGQWGDTSIGSFYGAIRTICEKITTDTTATFLVCTPIGRYNDKDKARETNSEGVPINNLGFTLRDYCDALVKTCHFYGVPVLDLNYDLGWNKYNVHNFTNDGLHPTTAGNIPLAKLICNEIKRYI